MKQTIFLILILVFSIMWGCGKNETTTSPYLSAISVNPEEFTFSTTSTAALTSKLDYVNITVLDKNGLPAPRQELFFRGSGFVTLRDPDQNVIDTSVGSVHGITGDSGNYILWVEYEVGGKRNYVTNIRITSATNDAWVEIAVDDDLT